MTRTRDYLPRRSRFFSIRERFVSIPPRQGVIAQAIAAMSNKQSVKITFLPTISDVGVLSDLVYRSSWYLSPIAERLQRVSFPVFPKVLSKGLSLPRYFDKEAELCRCRMNQLIEFREITSITDECCNVAEADVVLVWDSKLWDPPAYLSAYGVFRRGGKFFFNVDQHIYSREASTWLDIPRLFGASSPSVVDQCREKFVKMVSTLGSVRRAYVFGTGPSLEKISDVALLDGIRVVSNSLVRNEQLMGKIRPSIVCCGDPVFHIGCSSYAAEFRRNLAVAMERYSSLYAIVPITHYPYYRAHFPEKIFQRIIGVPIQKLGSFNFDLLSNFSVNQTGNILTMLMLPVASTLAREVGIAGCDGRSDKGQTYFWSHHAASQIGDKMDDAKCTHPGFFKISYTDYYDQHCMTLELLMQQGEQNGRIFRNITASHVPALERRNASYFFPSIVPVRPRVYTFCTLINGKVPEYEMALIKLWKASWIANGWEAVVLDESSINVDEKVAKMLVAYRNLPSVNRKRLDYYCFVRWIAVAQAGGGFMCDYDVINYSFHPRAIGNLTLYERSVPCLVSGTVAEYERIARLFASYKVTPNDQLQGRWHVSDMMILTKNKWLFEQAPGCVEFGHPGWENADAVHFSNLSMKPRSLMPRHEHIMKLRPFPTALPVF